MTNEKLEVLEAELSTVHSTTEKLVAALGSALRKCEREENHKLRVEIKANQGKVADLQKMRCRLAQQELALRYLGIEQRLEQERGAREGMALEESSVTGQLAAIEKKIEAFDCKPSWELTTLRKNLNRVVVEPLKRELETKVAAAEAGLNQARQQAEDLVSQLETVRSQLSASGTQGAGLKAELEKILVQGESHYRTVAGSLEEIRAALRDPRLTINRWGAEELLRNWQKGFQETLGSGTYGDLLRAIKFEVREATIIYWNDTGEIAGSVINSAMGDGEIWPKGGNVPFKLEREALEAQRAAATQAVAV